MNDCLVEVAIALVWREQRLLVSLRPAHVHLWGLWEFPGGKLLAGESPLLCAEREVSEEIGIRCTALSVRTAIEHAYPDRRLRLHPVDCQYQAGRPRCIGVEETRWVLPRQLSELIFPEANQPLLKDLTTAAL